MAGKTASNIAILPLKLCLDTFLEVKMAKTRLNADSVNETEVNIMIMPLKRPGTARHREHRMTRMAHKPSK